MIIPQKTFIALAKRKGWQPYRARIIFNFGKMIRRNVFTFKGHESFETIVAERNIVSFEEALINEGRKEAKH